MPDSYFLHDQGICESAAVGPGTRIWAFAHVLPGAVIGADCNICDHVFIENDVVLGDRVTVKGGVHLWDGLQAEDDVFIGPNATFTNDRFPRSKNHDEPFLRTWLGHGASIGAGAVILPGLRIGPSAMVGAGSVVTRDVPANAIVVGNPARIVGYVDSVPPDVHDEALAPAATVETSAVAGVRLVPLTRAVDMRGSLVAGEEDTQLPFRPARFFLVHGVPSKEVRGEHAHRECAQVLIAVAGSLSVLVDDGTRRQEFRLTRADVALVLPPMVWSVQYKYSADAVLLVLASRKYEPEDYLRTYESFLDALQASRS